MTPEDRRPSTGISIASTLQAMPLSQLGKHIPWEAPTAGRYPTSSEVPLVLPLGFSPSRAVVASSASSFRVLSVVPVRALLPMYCTGSRVLSRLRPLFGLLFDDDDIAAPSCVSSEKACPSTTAEARTSFNDCDGQRDSTVEAARQNPARATTRWRQPNPPWSWRAQKTCPARKRLRPRVARRQTATGDRPQPIILGLLFQNNANDPSR